MEISCYQKIFYTAEQFNGEAELVTKYNLKRKKAKDGTIRFYLGKRRVHLGGWLVHKKFSDKIEPVDNYAFKLMFMRGAFY